LLIVDFAEIQNGALRCLAAGQAPVLDHAEIPMILAIFVVPTLKAKGIFWRANRKCPPSAKVGLAPPFSQNPNRNHVANHPSAALPKPRG
jgi:hypothetical protein